MNPLTGLLVTLLTFNTGLLRVAGIDVVPQVAERAARQAVELETWAADHPEGVMALQEMWNPTQASALARRLEALGWTVWVPPQRAGWGATSGLLLAAGPHYQVIDRGFEGFAKKLGWEVLSAKGTAWVRLKLADGAGELVVLNTHLAAIDTTQGRLDEPRQLPLYQAQVDQVLSLAGRLTGGNAHWVLAGDFNAGELSGPEAWALWRSPEGSAFQTTPPLITWDSDNALVSGGLFPEAGTSDLDHALWPTAGGVTLVSSQTIFHALPPLSDHEALEVTLTVPGVAIKLSEE